MARVVRGNMFVLCVPPSPSPSQHLCSPNPSKLHFLSQLQECCQRMELEGSVFLSVSAIKAGHGSADTGSEKSLKALKAIKPLRHIVGGVCRACVSKATVPCVSSKNIVSRDTADSFPVTQAGRQADSLTPKCDYCFVTGMVPRCVCTRTNKSK